VSRDSASRLRHSPLHTQPPTPLLAHHHDGTRRGELGDLGSLRHDDDRGSGHSLAARGGETQGLVARGRKEWGSDDADSRDTLPAGPRRRGAGPARSAVPSTGGVGTVAAGVLAALRACGRGLQRRPFLTAAVLLAVAAWAMVHRLSRPASCSPPAWGPVPASLDLRGPPLPSYPGPPAPRPDKYTVLVNTFRRRDLLAQSIAAYHACPNVDAIHVVWSEPAPVPDRAAEPGLYSDLVDVVYHAFPTTSFTNRFQPVPGLRTTAVLSIDDDVYTGCGALDRAFAAWREAPQQLVGWYPRATARRAGGDGACRWEYESSLRTAWWHGEFSIALTKAAFMHRDWLAVFTERAPEGMKRWIDDHRNCEDIAMQMVVSHFTQSAPVAVVERSIADEGTWRGSGGQSAVSGQTGHLEARSECLNQFAALMGRWPLVPRATADSGGKWAWRLAVLFR